MKMFVVFEKEFKDMLRSKRLILIMATFVLSYVISIGSFVVMFSEQGAPMPPNIINLVLGSLVGYLSLIASIIGIALGFDAISGEHEKGTLRIVLSQPIFRDEFIVGKFLAALAVISFALVVATSLSLSSAVIMLGLTLKYEDVARVMLMVLFSIFLALAYYALSVLLSTVFKKSSTSALVSISLLIIFFVILPVLSTVIARAIAGPPPRIKFRPGMSKGEIAKIKEYQAKVNSIRESVLAFSLNHHFNLLAGSLVRYGSRSIGTTTGSTIPIDRVIVEVLSRNLNSLVILLIVIVVPLIISFILFTRSELK